MKKVIAVLILGLILLTGCDYFETEEIGNASEIEMSINNLPQLPDSLLYASWVVYGAGDAVEFLEILSVTQNTNPFILTAPLPSERLVATKRILISVEKKSTFDSSRVGTILMSGTFKTNDATVALNNYQVNTQYTGVYHLATPTDSSLATNELSGIWFADSIGNAAPVAGLDLPALTGSLTYHAWVEVNGVFLDIGKFSDPGKSDNSKIYSDTLSAGFGKPGEDFLLNPPAGVTFPLNLSNAKIYISVEPNWVKSTGPSTINVMTGTIPASAVSGQRYELQLNTLPSGFVSLKAI